MSSGEADESRTTLSDFTNGEEDDDEAGEDDGPIRKQVYVPAMNADRTSDETTDEGDNTEEEIENPSSDQGDELRQELLQEFGEAIESDAENVGRMFGDVIEEIHEAEEDRDLPGNEEDTRLYMMFETNHPDLHIPDEEDGEEMSEVEKAHMVSRVIRKYKHRWGIENGFKQIKSFRVRTTSMNHEYRFFNFLYACTMYNVWRLVDLLVKLELLAEAEFRHKPLVTADLFLTIAKDYVGLDPPD